jgi:hypothetical protein
MQPLRFALDSSHAQFAKDPHSMDNLSQIINLLEEAIKMTHQLPGNS